MAVILLARIELVGACFAPVGDAHTWVKKADVIMRARVVAAVEPDRNSPQEAHTEKVVSFEVLEVLKGGPHFSFSVRAGRIVFKGGPRLSFSAPGIITGQPDLNDGPVPYDMTRRGNGSCFARSYQLGGEYLFLLKDVDGKLTPYWASLAATNEQLRSAQDPWLLWVRRELERPTARR